MKLAFVHRRYTRRGGVERNVVALAEGMAERGHAVTVVCARTDERIDNGVAVERVPSFGPAGLKYRMFDREARAATENGYDLVQGFDLTTRQDVLRVGRGLGAIYRDILADERSAVDRFWQKLDPARSAMARLEEQMFAPGAFRKIVAISQRVRTEVIDTYGVNAEDIQVIYNGVDLDWFAPQDPPIAGVETPRKKDEDERPGSPTLWDIPENVPLVLFVGTGFRRKGLTTLLEAMAEVRQRMPDARLLVVGRDGRPDRYRRLAGTLGIADAVHWAGAQSDIHRYYNAADVLALPTRYEPFGNVVLEAMATGLPVVVSQVAGAAEVVTPDLSELILPDPRDASALADRLETVLADRVGERALPGMARRCAEAHPIGRMLDEYEKLYADLGAA